jgi:hypothetical protein
MIALRLVRLIEDHADELAETLLLKFRSSPHMRSLRSVEEEELRARCFEIYRNLSDWLPLKTHADIELRYLQVGERRACQGVSLADVIWGIVLTKEHLWSFLERQGSLRGALELYGELEFLRLLDQFFDRAVCYLAEGYEKGRVQTPEPHPETGNRRPRHLRITAPPANSGLQ